MVTDKIKESINRLIAHSGFQLWLKNEKVGEDDLVMVNNSFVFRDVKTSKAKEYIALSGLHDGATKYDVKIASGSSLNSDFKCFSGQGLTSLTIRALPEMVEEQLQGIGSLLFLLISEIDDSVVLEETLQHSEFKKAIWDPALGTESRIENDSLITGQVHDEESVWEVVTKHYETDKQGVPEGLREAVGIALDKLQTQAEAIVRLPAPGSAGDDGITDSILKVLKEQRSQYADALNRYKSSKEKDVSALNEILRIAYNFSSDASGYLRLIVSICDLKPVVLWGTIAEHYALSEAFRHLPWIRSRNKPSLKNYQSSIADARNTAFHNLFPFRKTLRVELPSDAIGQPSLRIFSEHGHKKDNTLSYRDKELVDVLVEFTRARDRQVPYSFWERNLTVMDRTIELFDASNTFIKLVHLEITKS